MRVPSPNPIRARDARPGASSARAAAFPRAAVLACIGSLALLGACGGAPPPEHLRIAGADPRRGAQAMQQYGCGSCHVIPGVPGARGLAGPPLADYSQRALLAGQLPNTPAMLVAWLRDPPALIPATGMPSLEVTEVDARDMAAYLYTLGAKSASAWPPPIPLDRPHYDDPDIPD